MSDIKTSSGKKESLEDIKKKIRCGYGVNERIKGDFDESLSARCENGIFVGKREGDIVIYKGIPYAKPPVGELRWKRPKAVNSDSGIYEAYYNGKTPIQTQWPTEQASYYPQGEDCLYLNIWENQSCRNTNKTVMVFLHGGSYGWGGTADPLYDGKNFVRANPDIIMVTVGYRTGLMGFVDLSYLKGGNDYPDAPNLGLLDQIEALRWIKRNISSFGGNPGNVTVFGESAGGGSVSLLPVIKEARGLFRRVIAESGSVALTFSKEECRDFTDRLIRETGMNSMDELMSLSEKDLMRINEKLNIYNNFPQRDGNLIPLNPYLPYENGSTRNVDIMIGTNANEINYWVGEVGGIIPFRFSIPIKFENDLRKLKKKDRDRVEKFIKGIKNRKHKIWAMAEFYNEVMFRLPAVRQAQGHSKNGGRVYMYYWIQPSSVEFRGACHAVELSYVFGNLNETIYTGDPADKNLSDTVMTMWANFARTGRPSTDRVEWGHYNTRERETMILSTSPHVMRDILSSQRKQLYPMLDYMINASYAALDYNVPFVRKVLGITAGAAVLAAAAGIAVIKSLKSD